MKKKIQRVDPEKYFRVANGTVVKGLMELDAAFDNMSDDTFQFHVNEWKNDFSNWIKDVINDKKLANELWGIKDRKKSQLVVLRRIIELLRENG